MRNQCAMSIGEKLRMVMTHTGLSQTAFAKKMGIPVTSYKKYELGQREPGASVLQTLAFAGVNPCWLLIDDGEMLLTDSEPKLADTLDINRLRLAIETVEEVLHESDREMTPAKKAEAIALAYDIFEEEEADEALAHTKKILAKLVKSLA